MQPRLMKYLLAWLITCLTTSTFAIMPADSTGFYSSFDNTRIHFTVKGKGEPVILLHGFMQNGDAWLKYPLYDSLLRQGFCVITLDMRGNGLSDKPHQESAYAGDAEARDIMALADHLHLNTYRIVGYSRGAIIASRVLLLDKRVRCGVMGGMGTAFTNPDWPRRWLFYRALSGENVPELAQMVKNVQAAGLDQQALALLQKQQPVSTPQELAGIHKPVLVIGGDKDEDNDTGGALAAMMPTGMHGTVTGDHSSTVRSPSFASWVLDFLQNH